MTALFSDSPWPGLAAWTLLYVSDYCLTIYCARLYAAKVRAEERLEGSYELTPMFQRDVDAGRRISPRFLLMLFLSTAWLSMMWLLSRERPRKPEIYEFVLGMLLLLELLVHVRHIKNVVFFRTGFGPDGVRGYIEYPRPLILRNSATELIAFAGLFLAAFAVTGSLFLLGGAMAAAATGLGHLRRSRKMAATRQPVTEPAERPEG